MVHSIGRYRKQHLQVGPSSLFSRVIAFLMFYEFLSDNFKKQYALTRGLNFGPLRSGGGGGGGELLDVRRGAY